MFLSQLPMLNPFGAWRRRSHLKHGDFLCRCCRSGLSKLHAKVSSAIAFVTFQKQKLLPFHAEQVQKSDQKSEPVVKMKKKQQ